MLRYAAVAMSVVGLFWLVPVGVAQAATSVPIAPSLLEGTLGYVGGAAPGGFHPTSGTVEVEFYSQPLALLEKVGPSGHFKITLAPGRYTVIGCGPTSSTGG